jgi:hypothetical protein
MIGAVSLFVQVSVPCGAGVSAPGRKRKQEFRSIGGVRWARSPSTPLAVITVPNQATTDEVVPL